MYKVKLEEFEGPLDLLLFLIKKNEVDIYDIPIAKITGQYLEYLGLMELLDLDIAGEFLVMAATLMQIKSKMLLPPQERPADAEEEPDPREELVRRLVEYKAFKEAASALQVLESKQQDFFPRPLDADGMEAELGGERFFEASLFDLISAFSTVLGNMPKETFLDIIKDQTTIEEKIHDILHMLVDKSSFSLKSFFQKAKSKIEMVVIFLALLELIKTQTVLAVQKEPFAEIKIIRNPKTIAPAKPV